MLRLVVLGRGQRWLYKRMAGSSAFSTQCCFPARQGDGALLRRKRHLRTPTFYDSCSLTVLEALASGLPAVTTRFNGASDAITTGDAGRVIDDPRNIDELAGAIVFYFDEERRARARTAARASMEQYPASRNVEETLAVYYEAARDS